MAHTDKLDNKVLDTIAGQIGSLYPRLASDPNLLRQPAELAETFAIWLLPTDKIGRDTENISDLAQNTGRWHSQVRIGNKALVAARSVQLGSDPKDWQVRQVFEGKFAESIDDAIKWIDENVKDDPLVCILEIPAFHITALWLVGDGGDRVVVANIPSGSQFLRRLQLYSSRDFLQALRKKNSL